MKFKKRFLSCILAGSILGSSAQRKDAQAISREAIGIGLSLAAVAGVIIYGIYSAYKESKAKKAEINRRNTLLCFSNAPERVLKIASQLVHKIPYSSTGGSIFDSLLTCQNDKNISMWSGLVAANSDWSSSTLDSICNILLTFEIECSVLQKKVVTKRKEEQAEAQMRLEREKMWQKERIENNKIYSKERENEKDREYDREKQIRQQVHENYMQDKQHWHENDMNYGRRTYIKLR